MGIITLLLVEIHTPMLFEHIVMVLMPKRKLLQNPFKLIIFFIYFNVIYLFCTWFIYPPPFIQPYTTKIHYFTLSFSINPHISFFYALTTDINGGWWILSILLSIMNVFFCFKLITLKQCLRYKKSLSIKKPVWFILFIYQSSVLRTYFSFYIEHIDFIIPSHHLWRKSLKD